MTTRTRPSIFNHRMEVKVDDLALNPALEDLRQAAPHLCRNATPAPKMFGSSDLPMATASGNDPQLLRQLPADFRHAAASADQEGWARIFSECSTEDGVMYARMFSADASHPDYADYVARVRAWAGGR